MKMSNNLKTCKYARLFLDTSALFKILVPEFKEPGTENLRNYLEIGMRIHTYSHCIGELMGILKRKWLSKKEKPNLTTDGYLMVINRLNWKIDNNKLVLHELALSTKFSELVRLIKKYNIDYVDALLLNHLLESKEYDLFVTADSALFMAARESGTISWNIVESATPE